MKMLDEMPIHNPRKTVYRMSLSIYPVMKCGSDLQEGEPLRVSEENEDLYQLKTKVDMLVLSVMSKEGYDGKCFVEVLIEKNGLYSERDEYWVEVDLVEEKVREIHG